MSDSVIAFKKRLVQLKNVLVTKRKIAEQLFYKTFKLEDNKSDREIILAIMKKNDMKTKRGNIVLDTKDGNEEKAVKSFLKEALPFLLTAFGVEKETATNQEKDQQEKPAATGLFAMQDEIETGDIEPENILTSSAVSEPNNAAIPPETQSVVESQSKPTPQTSEPAPNDLVTNPPAMVNPPSEIAGTGEIAPAKPPVVLPRQPLTVTSSQSIQRKMSLEQKLNKVQPDGFSTPPPEPPQVEQETTATVPSSPEPPASSKGVSSAVGESVPTAAAPVEVQPVQEIPESPQKPVPAVIEPDAEAEMKEEPPTSPEVVEVKYEFFICSRCGNEINRFEVETEGSYIVCPRCNFQFSMDEAQKISKVISTSTSSEEQSMSATSKHQLEPGDEGLVRPSQLFGGDQANQGEDESLVRPSQLFGNKDEGAGEDAAANQGTAPSTPVKPKPAGDRLVRPSEFLKQKELDTTTVGEAPEPKKQQVQKPQAITMARRNQESNDLVKPSELESESMGETDQVTCPNCGSPKYTKIQDRNKIISYNPLVYGYKKKCVLCSHEFD